MISFDAQMRAIHDHLYSSANIRVPEDLQVEVAKVIQVLTWRAVTVGAYLLDDQTCASIVDRQSDEVHKVAADLRNDFTAYNKAMARYPRAEAVLKLDDFSLSFIVAALNKVDMADVNRDWMGDALEVFRSTAAKRIGGQFFTDQRITQLAVELLDYNPHVHDFVDMCAGTGGFLLAATRKARDSGVQETPKIFGVEVDSSLAHLANSTVKQFGNLSSDPVFNADSLRSHEEWPLQLRKTIVESTHARLATNPPFGQKITIKDKEILSRFELGHIWSKKEGKWLQTSRISPTPPDILFIEKNVKLSIPGEGRVAIVLPYQILSGPKLGYVREWLLRNTKILSVVDLPDVAFQPWTGTKTALVVVERRKKPLDAWNQEEYPIFMSVSKEIGHDRRGNPILDNSGKIISDVETIADDYKEYISGNNVSGSKSFVISSAEISVENDIRINAAYYSPERFSVRKDFTNLNPDEFEVKLVKQVVKSIFFPGRFKREYVNNPGSGIPFYGGTNITQIQPTNKKYLSSEYKKLDEYKVEKGWILVTRSGSTGIVSSVPDAWNGHAISEHVIRIVPDETKLRAEYIEVYLRSEVGQKILAQGIFGSVIDEITPEHIENIPIPIPKNKEILENIVRAQERANRSRDEAMSSITLGNNLVEELFSGHILSTGLDSINTFLKR